MKDNHIVVQGLCKNFGDFLLDHISFEVPKGKIVGFIGENGAGKSTTINLILNEFERDAGKIEVLGVDNTILSVKDEIGVVFDECNFHEVLNAKDIGKIFAGVYSAWDDGMYRHYLKQFHIPLNKPIGSFSKGMKMKLSIICAMAHKPKLLILDEATTGLDPVVRDEVLNLFLEFIQDGERSVFFSSHITTDIEKIADYVIFIHQGKIVFEEQKDSLIYSYGIAKCGQEQFHSISPGDYMISRKSNVGMECLVADQDAFRKKYKDIVVDNVTLEDIMLFYIKGGTPCGD
ncbi:MAG: ABC transporter ATP-binding protein [Clostridia bacterium]|nr:ABC transporter ATP-binding protein [Clostridia bacterium]